MVNKFTVRYLPLFYQDFVEILDYIKYSLKNPEAALKLIADVENAINERMQNPESFERFESIRERMYPYYRLYVKNFTVLYVVIDESDNGESESSISEKKVEIRRILYSQRNYDELL